MPNRVLKTQEIRYMAALVAVGIPRQDVAKIMGLSNGGVTNRITRNVGGIQEIINEYENLTKVPIACVYLRGDA